MKSWYTCLPALLLASCGLSTGDVKSVNGYTTRNKLYSYEYLTISDSASLSDLISVTRQIASKKSEGAGEETLYNYSIGSGTTRRFAMFDHYKLRGGGDTLVVIQYPQQDASHTRAAAAIQQRMEKDDLHFLPDSCMGVWRNWLNPFGFYLFIYKKDSTHYVQEFSLGMGGETKPASVGSDLTGKFLQVEHLGVSVSESHIARYKLNQYNDIHLTYEEPPGSTPYLVGIYSYVCDCRQQQAWDL